MDRRSLVKKLGIAGATVAAGALAACGNKDSKPAAGAASGAAPAVSTGDKVRWRLASSFPKSLDTLFGAAEKFAKTVNALSGGKFEVSVHPAGELMPAFGIVDALQNDTIEMGQTASYYYTGKDPVFAFGTAVPFGLTKSQTIAWHMHGNGGKLLNEFYSRYNIIGLSSGNTGTQMGGWYRKEINTVDDLKGLKMRLGGGLFGESMQKLGVVPQNMPVGDVYQALEKGTLDAVEFIGPYDDEKLGFNKVAPNYYFPGWWEAGADLNFFVNKKAFEKLSPENQAIVRAACDVAARDMSAKYDAWNPQALKRLVAAGVKLHSFSKDILDAGFRTAQEVYAEHSAKSPEFKKIFEDMRAFQKEQALWNRSSEYRYNQYVATIENW